MLKDADHVATGVFKHVGATELGDVGAVVVMQTPLTIIRAAGRLEDADLGGLKAPDIVRS